MISNNNIADTQTCECHLTQDPEIMINNISLKNM